MLNLERLNEIAALYPSAPRETKVELVREALDQVENEIVIQRRIASPDNYELLARLESSREDAIDELRKWQ